MDGACGKPVENVDKSRRMSKIKGLRTMQLWISLWTVWVKPLPARGVKMQETAFFHRRLCSRKGHTRLSMGCLFCRAAAGHSMAAGGARQGR